MSMMPPAKTCARVVVADNDPMIRSILRSLLARLGLDLVAVSDGQQAIAAASPETSLYLLDLDMPGGGGLAVCRALRTRVDSEAPIAILTGCHDEDLRRRCLQAGATLFLTKPFNPAELLRALAPHLPLDARAINELSHLKSIDRGLRLQDSAAARTASYCGPSKDAGGLDSAPWPPGGGE